MDLSAIQTALRALGASAGPKASISFSVEPDKCYIYFRPTGWDTGSPFILGDGVTFDECLSAATSKWEAMAQRVHAETVKKLALAIIRITHEIGECTDASLRTEFSADEIRHYGTESIGLANSMAERGPFSIVELQGANAA